MPIITSHHVVIIYYPIVFNHKNLIYSIRSKQNLQNQKTKFRTFISKSRTKITIQYDLFNGFLCSSNIHISPKSLTHCPTEALATAAASATTWAASHSQHFPIRTPRRAGSAGGPATAAFAPATVAAACHGARRFLPTRSSPPPRCPNRYPAQNPCRTNRASRSIRDAASTTNLANCPSSPSLSSGSRFHGTRGAIGHQPHHKLSNEHNWCFYVKHTREARSQQF